MKLNNGMDFNFADFKIPQIATGHVIPPLIESMILADEALEEEMEEVNKVMQERHDAILRTAESTAAIDGKFSLLSNDLSAERDERKKSDVENLRYTKRWNRLNLVIAIFALAIAVAGLVVAIVK